MASGFPSEDFVKPSKVARILEEDPILLGEWVKFADDLGIRRRNVDQLKKKCRGEGISHYELCKKLVVEWISLGTSDGTIGALAKVLGDLDFGKLRDDLLASFDSNKKIQDKHESNNQSKPLSEKWYPNKKQLINSFEERMDKDILIVEKLHQYLVNRETNATVINQIHTVSGMGGIGKTTLAKWYANKYEAEYEFIIWIDCGEGWLQSSLTKLKQKLNIKEDGKKLDVEETARVCFEKLDQHHCLLIYDNADSYKGADGIQHALPENRDNFHVLITSRATEWGHETGFGKIQQYHLSLFREEEGVAFLKKNISKKVPGPYNDNDFRKISKLVDHLPLALQIALTMLNKGVQDMNKFIQSLETSNEILYKNVQLDDYEKPVYKTLMISIEKIRGEERYGHTAYKILQYLAYLPPDNTDIDYFSDLENENLDFIKSAIDLLESYSLVTLPFSPNSVCISIHRLLQKVLKEANKINGVNESVLLKILVTETRHWTQLKSAYIEARNNLKFKQICSFVRNNFLQFSKCRFEALFMDHVSECKELISSSRNIHYSHLISLINFAFINFKNKNYEGFVEAFKLLQDSAVSGNYIIECDFIEWVKGTYNINFIDDNFIEFKEEYPDEMNGTYFDYPGIDMNSINVNYSLVGLHEDQEQPFKFIDRKGSIFVLNLMYLISLRSSEQSTRNVNLLYASTFKETCTLEVRFTKLYYADLIRCANTMINSIVLKGNLIVEQEDFVLKDTNSTINKLSLAFVTIENSIGSEWKELNFTALIPSSCTSIELWNINDIDIFQLCRSCLNVTIRNCRITFISESFSIMLKKLKILRSDKRVDVNKCLYQLESFIKGVDGCNYRYDAKELSGYLTIVLDHKVFLNNCANYHIKELILYDVKFLDSAGLKLTNVDIAKMIPPYCTRIKLFFMENIVDVCKLSECCSSITIEGCNITFLKTDFISIVEELKISYSNVSGDINIYFMHANTLRHLELEFVDIGIEINHLPTSLHHLLIGTDCSFTLNTNKVSNEFPRLNILLLTDDLRADYLRSLCFKLKPQKLFINNMEELANFSDLLDIFRDVSCTLINVVSPKNLKVMKKRGFAIECTGNCGALHINRNTAKCIEYEKCIRNQFTECVIKTTVFI